MRFYSCSQNHYKTTSSKCYLGSVYNLYTHGLSYNIAEDNLSLTKQYLDVYIRFKKNMLTTDPSTIRRFLVFNEVCLFSDSQNGKTLLWDFSWYNWDHFIPEFGNRNTSRNTILWNNICYSQKKKKVCIGWSTIAPRQMLNLTSWKNEPSHSGTHSKKNGTLRFAAKLLILAIWCLRRSFLVF